MMGDNDPSTISNFTEVAVTSWHLSAEADFTCNKIVGTVTLRASILSDNVTELVS